MILIIFAQKMATLFQMLTHSFKKNILLFEGTSMTTFLRN